MSNPLLTKNSPYSPRDFTNIVYIGYAPLVILTHPGFAPRNPKELIEYAKANPGKISWGSSGTGTSPHIAILLFQSATGTNVTHIPYKGAAPNMTDLIARQIDVIYTTTVSSEPQIKAKRVRGIARREPVAREDASGRADARRVRREECRSADLVRPAGAAQDAAGDRHEAQRRNEQGAADAGRAGRVSTQLGFEIAGGPPKEFDALVRNEIQRIEKLLAAGLLAQE